MNHINALVGAMLRPVRTSRQVFSCRRDNLLNLQSLRCAAHTQEQYTDGLSNGMTLKRTVSPEPSKTEPGSPRM
jgi:hypothetical protein